MVINIINIKNFSHKILVTIALYYKKDGVIIRTANGIHLMLALNKFGVAGLTTALLANKLALTGNIQRASNVRSTKGLLVHVFGKLAAALIGFIL